MYTVLLKPLRVSGGDSVDIYKGIIINGGHFSYYTGYCIHPLRLDVEAGESTLFFPIVESRSWSTGNDFRFFVGGEEFYVFLSELILPLPLNRLGVILASINMTMSGSNSRLFL